MFLKSLLADQTADASNRDAQTLLDLFREEYSVVESAVFTEPDDQSAWWYYHFVTDAFCAPACLATPGYPEQLLQEIVAQKEGMQSLLEMEGGSSKWVLTALVMLVDTARVLTTASAAGGVDDVLEGCGAEREEYVAALCAVDPSRARCYLHRLSPSSHTTTTTTSH